MDTWIDCGARFVKADVIRWKEAVFDGPFARNGRRARRGKRVMLGEIEVIAEVLAEADAKGFVRLLVRASQVISARDDVPVAPQASKINAEYVGSRKPSRATARSGFAGRMKRRGTRLWESQA